MKNCKECFHYELCQALEDNGQASKIHPNECYFYKNKELVIELPCKVGDTVFIISKKGYVYRGKFRLDDIDQIGKRIFLDEESAIRALRKKVN